LLRADESARRRIRSVYGCERPNFFAPPILSTEAELAKPDVLLNENHPEGDRPREKVSFRRSNDFAFIGAECRNVP